MLVETVPCPEWIPHTAYFCFAHLQKLHGYFCFCCFILVLQTRHIFCIEFRFQFSCSHRRAFRFCCALTACCSFWFCKHVSCSAFRFCRACCYENKHRIRSPSLPPTAASSTGYRLFCVEALAVIIIIITCFGQIIIAVKCLKVPCTTHAPNEGKTKTSLFSLTHALP